MSSDLPILRLDLLSILAFAFSVLLGLTPAVAQDEDAGNEDAREEYAQKENIRERERLPEGYSAQQARFSGQVGGIRVPLGNLREEGAARAVGRGAGASRAEVEPAGSNLVMRAAAGLDGVGSFGSSTSIADVDGDGNQDLLITGGDASESPTATLYLGDGQGGFSEADAGLTGVRFGSSTSIADVDGDGNQDLLITGEDASESPTATLYLGDEQGEFTEAGAGLAGVRNSSTSIADIDEDGDQDLLITGRDANNDETATLYLGDGQGGFSKAAAGLNGTDGGSTSIADVDRDGNQDLLITGRNASFNRTATLYLGDGQGGFSEADAGLTGVGLGSSTSIADVDGDGNQDLLITGRDANNDETATLYLGDGQGGFSEADAGLTGIRFSSSTSIADLQGDGDPDLLVTGFGALFGESARVYVNRQNQSPPNRAPTFARTSNYDRPLAPGVTLRRFVEAGDPDGDALSIGMASGPSNVSVSDRGNGTAKVTFTPTRNQGGDVIDFSIEVSDSDGATDAFSVSVKVSPDVAAFSTNLSGADFGSSTSIGDVDGDGNQDLLITGDSESGPMATLYLGDGQGEFSEAGASLSGVIQSSTSIADVDGDQNKDLLISGDAFDPTTTLYLGDGQGEFSEAGAGLTGTENGSTSIADVDGDGNQDLLITGDSNSGPTATLYLGDGQGGFSEASASLSGVAQSSTSIADVDGDQNTDLLIIGENSNDNPTATLYLGDGQGGFSEAGTGLSGTEDGSTSIADVDGDGNQDLLITGRDANGSETATLYLGDGHGEFAETGAGLTAVDNSSTSIADVNGDGARDLLITGRDQNTELTATLYLGDGQGGFTEASAGLAGVTSGSVSTADVDNDQDEDLLITGFSAASRSASATLYENLFDNPLPVELTGLEATADGDKVRLTWSTASETGNAGFRVQRRVANATSPSAVKGQNRAQNEWTELGQVKGSGTTTEVKTYRFTDADLPYRADRLQYRLKQVDTDGSVSYTESAVVERTVSKVELLGTYPNPARGRATVRYGLPDTREMSLKLYDMLGRQVRTVAEGKKAGRHERQVDLRELPSGAYFLRLQSKGQVRTQKLMVVR